MSKTSSWTWKEFSGLFDLQTKAIRYIENSADIHKSTDHNIPEYRSENLEPHNIVSDDNTGTCDTVLVCRSPGITLFMKLTWNELTSKSGLPLVRSMVSKPQAQQCELPLWSSHSIRVWITLVFAPVRLQIRADNVFGQIGLEITYTHICICNPEVVCPRTAAVRKITKAEAAEHDRKLLKI